MEIIDYIDALKKVNLNYREEHNPLRWKIGHKEFEKMSRLSFTSPDHRGAFIEALKKNRLTE